MCKRMFAQVLKSFSYFLSSVCKLLTTPPQFTYQEPEEISTDTILSEITIVDVDNTDKEQFNTNIKFICNVLLLEPNHYKDLSPKEIITEEDFLFNVTLLYTACFNNKCKLIKNRNVSFDEVYNLHTLELALNTRFCKGDITEQTIYHHINEIVRKLLTHTLQTLTGHEVTGIDAVQIAYARYTLNLNKLESYFAIIFNKTGTLLTFPKDIDNATKLCDVIDKLVKSTEGEKTIEYYFTQTERHYNLPKYDIATIKEEKDYTILEDHFRLLAFAIEEDAQPPVVNFIKGLFKEIKDIF